MALHAIRLTALAALIAAPVWCLAHELDPDTIAIRNFKATRIEATRVAWEGQLVNPTDKRLLVLVYIRCLDDSGHPVRIRGPFESYSQQRGEFRAAGMFDLEQRIAGLVKTFDLQVDSVYDRGPPRD